MRKKSHAGLVRHSGTGTICFGTRPVPATATNHDSGLSLPVSVNELQKKLEEEVDRRRERWEEEQGKHLSGEEALMSSTRKNLVQQEGEGESAAGVLFL